MGEAPVVYRPLGYRSDLMTFPCVNEDQFEMVDGTDLQPQPYMQWRHVATNEAPGQVLILNPVGGSGQAADIYQLQVSWTNPDPLPMNVYCLITRGGSRMAISAQNTAYIETYSGFAQGAAPADPTASTLVSRFGTGCDFGTNLIGQIENRTTETRAGERTALFGPTIVLPSTQQYKARVRLRIDALAWSGAGVSGTEGEFTVDVGGTRLDLVAYPAIP